MAMRLYLHHSIQIGKHCHKLEQGRRSSTCTWCDRLPSQHIWQDNNSRKEGRQHVLQSIKEVVTSLPLDLQQRCSQWPGPEQVSKQAVSCWMEVVISVVNAVSEVTDNFGENESSFIAAAAAATRSFPGYACLLS